MATASGQRVVLHVGLPKTGTTYLQGLLAEHRDSLRERGVLYPFLRPGGMFHAAVEVRGSHEKFGLDQDAIEGSWAALCARAREHNGTTIISHEILGGADEDEIAAALTPLEGLEVHVVVTARDLGRQATAHWQEEVKLGDVRSFADFERDQFRADLSEDLVRAGAERPHFWHAQDFAAALGRWSTAVPFERVHLVVCPPPGAAPSKLWHRFADAAGVPADAVDPGRVPPNAVNASLGRAEIAVLRRVNAALAGSIPQPAYSQIVKRVLAEDALARRHGERPRTPAALVPLLSEATDRWSATVRAAGHPVSGDLGDLRPLPPPDGTPHPDDVDESALLEVTSGALAEVLQRFPLPSAAPPEAPPPRSGTVTRRSGWRAARDRGRG
ncbi:hypothetical protein [Nocardioides bigeumensis]|uniref:Sulfotransferase family protein n=1 Tax=Nocardioides bigeumensis TaxID=433657 RepID=A0ABN2YDM9_9ACTN